MQIIVMLLSLIVGVAIIGRNNDNDMAEGTNENATDQPSLPVAQNAKDGRSQLLLDSRRIVTTATTRLLAALLWLTDVTKPTELVNRLACELLQLKNTLVEVSKQMVSAGVHVTYGGMYPREIESQLREAAKTGRKWAVILCGYYSNMVNCNMCDIVQNARNICDATVSGIMATINTEWSDDAGVSGGRVEVSRGLKHKGNVAMDWIISQTNKATWEAALAFLGDYRGRSNRYYNSNQQEIRFAESVIDAFTAVETAESESAFNLKVKALGYTTE